jgi:hypothetical protein
MIEQHDGSRLGDLAGAPLAAVTQPRAGALHLNIGANR